MKRLAVVLALGLVGACTSSASTPTSSPAASGSAGSSPGTVAISLQPPVSGTWPTPRARSRISSSCGSGGGPTPSARGRSCSCRRSRTSSARTSLTGRGTTCRTCRCSGTGRGSVLALGRVERPTLADVAPTQGKLLDFAFDAPDGGRCPRSRSPTRLADRDARLGCRWPEPARRVPERLAGAALDDPRRDRFDHASVAPRPRSRRPPTPRSARARSRCTPGRRMRSSASAMTSRAGRARPGPVDGADARRPVRPRDGQRAARWGARERDLAPQHGEPRVAVGRGDRDIAVLRVPTAADNEGLRGRRGTRKAVPPSTSSRRVNDLPRTRPIPRRSTGRTARSTGSGATTRSSSTRSGTTPARSRTRAPWSKR